jgi:hypothetical protein
MTMTMTMTTIATIETCVRGGIAPASGRNGQDVGGLEGAAQDG